MKGQKIAFVAGAVLAGGLCLAGAWMAYSAFAKADLEKSTLEETLGKLQKAYKKDPFPNRTNVAVATNDAHRLNEWNEALGRDLCTNEVFAATNTLTPSAFIQQLQHTVRELDALASSSGNKVLPDGFAYGFGQYLGAGGSMPKPEDVKRLDTQLRMVDLIVRELLASHVSAVAQVDREGFETGPDAAAGTPATSRHGGHRAAPMTPAPTSRAPSAGAYPHQHFVFAFDATEAALDDVLDRLAVMPLFVVVSEVSVQREERGLKPPPDQATEADRSRPVAAAAVKPTADSADGKVKTPALLRSARGASGPEIAPLLKVHLQLDVYTFVGV